MILTATTLAVAALFSATTYAAEPLADSVLDQAQSLMGTREASAAYALLAPLEPQRAGDPRFDYLLGIAAIDAGHVTRAIFALERVVAEQPGNSIAHAELARAYLAAGETAAAKAELQLARSGNIPTEAAASIDRVLGAIEQPAPGGKRVIRGYVDLSVGYDGNLNSATRNGEVALPAFGGIVLTLDPASQKRSAPFMAFAAGSDLQVPLSERWTLVANVNGRRTFTSSDHDLNQRQADGSIGAAWTREADTLSASLQTSTFWLGGNRYRNADGVSAQWQHSLAQASQVSAFSQWSRLTYPGQENRDADRSVLGLGYAKALGVTDGTEPTASTTVVYGSVYGASEDVRSSGFDNFGHHALGIRGGAEYRSGPATWFAALQYESRRYGGPEPFFDTTRHDRQSDLSLGVHYFPLPLWRLTPQISTTRSASNVALYDYRRTVLQLTLRREFY